jgi:hypothetical protein
LKSSKAVLAFTASGVESVALHTDSIDSNFDSSISKIAFSHRYGFSLKTRIFAHMMF